MNNKHPDDSNEPNRPVTVDNLNAFGRRNLDHPDFLTDQFFNLESHVLTAVVLKTF